MSLVTAFKSAIKGEYVEDKVYEQRLATCRKCENLTGGNCRKCFCFVKIKNWFPDESCPIGKWDAVEKEVSEEPKIVHVDEVATVEPVIEEKKPKKKKS